jgi:citrate lyase subunit beta/citryl-CoA lyase
MLRSYLFVPGDNAEKLTKALARGADALIVDLEDGVAFSNKTAARTIVSDFLQEKSADWPSIWIRLNPGDLMEIDLASIPSDLADGFVLAKTQSAKDISALVDGLGASAKNQKIMALVEDGLGITKLSEITSHAAVNFLQIGEADLSADLSITPDAHSSQFNYVRQQTVVACAAAGIAAPIGPVSTNFRDLDLFRETTQALSDMGYFGRACIHPAQVEIVNSVFTPTAQQLESAQDTMQRYESASSKGLGVCVDANGRLVDEAIIRSARRILETNR